MEVINGVMLWLSAQALAESAGRHPSVERHGIGSDPDVGTQYIAENACLGGSEKQN